MDDSTAAGSATHALSPLQLIDVADALKGSGLRNPEFPFLTRHPDLVRIAMFQPTGVIVPRSDQVRVQDRDLLTAQLGTFLYDAHAESADLVLCPEYCCTWDVLLGIAEAGITPAEGKLWALGCESATSTQLAPILEQLRQSFTVVFDETAVSAAGDFVDVLVYLFRTRSENGTATRLTALLQPKTEPMGGTAFEKQHLKRGRTLHRFRNAAEPTNSLVCLLCSDVLHPDFTQLIPRLQYDTFVVHLQMNDNPSLPGFRQYRSSCCQLAPRTSEVLCLNWARGTTIMDNGGASKPFIEEPKTMLFRAKEQLDIDDATLTANHANGCYLTNWHDHQTAAFIFSPDPHVFRFDTTKPSVMGHGATTKRTGPIMVALKSWDSAAFEWKNTAARDGFSDYWLSPYPQVAAHLTAITNDPLRVERLIQLSTGHARDMRWANCWNLISFELAADDTAQRLTLCWSDAGKGHVFRQICLADFRGFAAIAADITQFSNRLVAFTQTPFTVAFNPSTLSKTFRNLHLPNGRAATAIYLGASPRRERLLEVKKRTMDGLCETESDLQLIAIWYRDDNGVLHDFMDEDIPEYNDDPGKGPVFIDNTSS